MSEEAKEPSQGAREAEAKIRAATIRGELKTDWYWEHGSKQQALVLGYIEQAIDAATAAKDTEIELLKSKNERLSIDNAKAHLKVDEAALATIELKDQRISQLESYIEEAIAAFFHYLNVPESVALKAKWAKLKPESAGQTPSTPVAPSV